MDTPVKPEYDRKGAEYDRKGLEYDKVGAEDEKENPNNRALCR